MEGRTDGRTGGGLFPPPPLSQPCKEAVKRLHGDDLQRKNGPKNPKNCSPPPPPGAGMESSEGNVGSAWA